ncbi:MAG: hypothetical protein AAF386_01195 [Pseudomonadota bacterium]
MHILDISIMSMRRSLDGKRVLGDVIFRIGGQANRPDRDLRVSCDTVFSSRIRPDAILVGDAIRQVRRLPHIRCGENRLTFASGLRPLSKTQTTIDTARATG